MKITPIIALSATALLAIAPMATAVDNTSPAPVKVAAEAAPLRAPANDVQARAAAGNMKKALRLNQDEQLVVKNVTVDSRTGLTHTRYDRTFKGLRVIGGDLVVHQKKDGQIKETSFNASGKVAVDSVTPKVGKSQAVSAAAKSLTNEKSNRGGELVVFARGAKPVLAYDVVSEGFEADQTPFRIHTYIDARTGKVLDSDNEIMKGSGNGVQVGQVSFTNNNTSSGYTLRDSKGHFTCNFANGTSNCAEMYDSDNVWGNGSQSNAQSAAVDAFFGAQKSYDYFQEIHNRAGIWNNGKGAGTRVHYGNSYNNAFWDGSVMTFGDTTNNAEPLTALDVTAHEMGHGVTQTTAGLVYKNESGGLNESYSDIWATAVEFYVNLSKDPGDYYIGEQIDGFGPIRRMDIPSLEGSSNYDCYKSGMGTDDVHYTSGPNNRAFYLMSEGTGVKTIGGLRHEGRTCNSTTFTGIGHLKAEKIMFRAYNYLTTTSGYQAMRDAAIQSAIDLHGASSAECHAVQNAYKAILAPAGSKSCSGTGGDPGTPVPGDGTLTNGQSVAISGSAGSEQFWTIAIPSGASNLVVSMAGGTGDADLYVKAGSKPTDSSYDCRPYKTGNTESCTFATPVAGTYYVRVKAYSAFSGATLKATWTTGGGSDPGTPIPGSQLLVNPGFESGPGVGWTGTTGPITTSGSIAARTGTYKLFLGGNGSTATENMSQTVTIPANATSAKFSFYLRIDSAETSSYTAYDKMNVQVNGTTLGNWSNLDENSGYVQKTFDLSSYKGQSVTIKFNATEDSSAQTSFVVDDTALDVS